MSFFSRKIADPMMINPGDHEIKRKKGYPVSVRKEKERCLLVALDYAESYIGETEKNLDELSRLIETAGGNPVARITQSLRQSDPLTFVHRGKLDEIKNLSDQYSIDTIVFDEELTPVQIKNIEKAMNIKIIDRTELILTIFSNNAKSRLSKLQIELAKLEYTLPRLQRMWTHLSRQKGGIGLKGPGERQIELDRRLLLKRMTKIKRDLSAIKQGIDIRRQKRRDEYRVSLVGYTNSGKSTLLSQLSSAPVYCEDKLFSTLDTLIRKVQLNDRRHILISDTVGFIRKLPHQLVESFYATLSEVLNSDMILTVIDISQSDFIKRAEVVLSVLHDIGADRIPNSFVLNKMDLLDENTLAEKIKSFEGFDKNPLILSALKNRKIEPLKNEILKRIRADEYLLSLKVDSRRKDIINRIFLVCEVISLEERDTWFIIQCYAKREYAQELKGFQV